MKSVFYVLVSLIAVALLELLWLAPRQPSGRLRRSMGLSPTSTGAFGATSNGDRHQQRDQQRHAAPAVGYCYCMIQGKHTSRKFLAVELLDYQANYTPWGNVQSGNFTFTGVYTQQNPANPVNGSAYADFLLGRRKPVECDEPARVRNADGSENSCGPRRPLCSEGRHGRTQKLWRGKP